MKERVRQLELLEGEGGFSLRGRGGEDETRNSQERGGNQSFVKSLGLAKLLLSEHYAL